MWFYYNLPCNGINLHGRHSKAGCMQLVKPRTYNKHWKKSGHGLLMWRLFPLFVRDGHKEFTRHDDGNAEKKKWCRKKRFSSIMLFISFKRASLSERSVEPVWNDIGKLDGAPSSSQSRSSDGAASQRLMTCSAAILGYVLFSERGAGEGCTTAHLKPRRGLYRVQINGNTATTWSNVI